MNYTGTEHPPPVDAAEGEQVELELLRSPVIFYNSRRPKIAYRGILNPSAQ
jgi:hypothetical protein